MTEDPATRDGQDRVLAAIERLDERLRRLQDQVADKFQNLNEQFVPRPELLQRFTEVGDLRKGLESAQVTHRSDVQRLEDALANAEQRRITDRRWAVGALLASAAPLFALLTVILTHWK